MSYTLYFIRHGQTDWNLEGRLQGHTDIPINSTGQAQAEQNGETLARILAAPEEFHFVSSPLVRARKTMEIIRQTIGLEPSGYDTDNRLMEVRFGEFEGLKFDEIATQMPEEFKLRENNKWLYTPPGGESYADLTARVGGWYDSIDRDTVCVAHGGVSRGLRGVVLNLDPNSITDLPVPQDKVLKVEAGQIEWL